jgi:putative CocE/NonD family hydrolase
MSSSGGLGDEYDVIVEPDRLVPMRDGVRLATDVYRPARRGASALGRFPAVVERTPYDKKRPVLAETGEYFARHGYVAVMQDVRGRHGSEGVWRFLAPVEGPDGFDTLDWITRQTWSDGQVGTMGLSYSTTNQQALALLRPPGLEAQFLGDGGYNYFHRTLRHSGAFELGVALPYVLRMAMEGQELARDPEARRSFEEALSELPSWICQLPLRFESSPLRFAPEYLRWLLDMCEHSDYGAYWQHPGWNLEEHVGDYPDVPVFLQTSWYGHHVWATTEKFSRLSAQRTPKKLLIGPWLHGYDDYPRSFCGEVEFGAEAALDSLNDLKRRWFDQHLQRCDTGILEEPRVRLFVMGGGSGRRNGDGRLEHGGSWRGEREWPLTRTRWTRFFLHGDGSLRTFAPPSLAPPSRYTYDPRDPVPTIGGGTQNPLFPGLIQGGAFDQRGRSELWVCRDTRPLSSRPDVLVFQTDPLTEDVEVTGPITVRLFVASSAADTDFTAKLLDVYPPSHDYPEGFAMNLTDSVVRARYRSSRENDVPLTPGEVYEILIEPQATSNLFRASHRVRLDLSSSNFPRFDPNPNTGEPGAGSARSVVAQNTIFHDAERASHVVLPLIPR